MRHEPGLDGIRAVGMVMVLLTHAGFAWAPGGFVGVSAFFALSGYLITTLLIRPPPIRSEMARFWVRRFRRLIPAIVVTVAGVLVLALFVDLGPTNDSLRGDARASLLYYANWHFLGTGQSYDAIFTTPTPFQHMWSLAIEEQFYVFFPLLVFGLRRAGMSIRSIGLTAVGLWVGAVLVNLWTGAAAGVNTTYLATHARLSEILTGAALAALVPGLLDPQRRELPTAMRRAVGTVAIIGSAICVLVFFTIRDSDQPIAEGILPLLSVASIAVVAGTLLVPSFSRVLSWGPMPILGQMSYAIYLVHWPIYVWLNPVRTGLDTLPLFALRVSVSLTVAAALHWGVILPFRAGSPVPVRRLATMAAPALLVTAALVVIPYGTDLSIFEAAEAELHELVDDEPPPPAHADASAHRPERGLVGDAPETIETTPTMPPLEPTVVAVFGDSTAFFTQLGVARWADANPTQMWVVPGSTKIGCPLVRVGRHDFQQGEVAPGPECDWTERWPDLVAEHEPDIAVLQVGPWEVAEFRHSVDDPWTRIGDPSYDELLQAEFHAAFDALTSRGAHVVALSSPYVEVGLLDLNRHQGGITASEPWRMDLFNEMLIEVTSARDDVSVVDLAGYVATISSERVDTDWLPDGLHFTGDTAEAVAEWLGPEILAAAPAPPAS